MGKRMTFEEKVAKVLEIQQKHPDITKNKMHSAYNMQWKDLTRMEAEGLIKFPESKINQSFNPKI